MSFVVEVLLAASNVDLKLRVLVFGELVTEVDQLIASFLARPAHVAKVDQVKNFVGLRGKLLS
jgi:hypothetical protein